MRKGLQVLALAVAVLAASVTGASAQMMSDCLAIAQSLPRAVYAALTPAAVEQGTVSITYVGHSTFVIETAGGVTIATDYAGWHGRRDLPRVVTMNRAHSSHYTDAPDPGIEHVLRGWGEDGTPAAHDLEVGDVRIRNVTTDIRDWQMGVRKDANSIFIFEIAGLCIGHLGHLHHDLGPGHIGSIGRLDVVMVPVDGSYTMSQEVMVEVLEAFKARIVLPMHVFGPTTLARFVSKLQDRFAISHRSESSLLVSARALPDRPTVIVLPPEY